MFGGEKKATVVTKDAEQEMLRKRINEMRHFLKRKQAESQNIMSNWSEGLLKKSQFMMIN